MVSTLVDSKSAGQGKELTEASRRLEISEIRVVPRKEQNCIDNYTSDRHYTKDWTNRDGNL